ncbi:MAG: hypothetical protein ABI165_18250, partial [Bryobacteraceae bacterium]
LGNDPDAARKDRKILLDRFGRVLGSGMLKSAGSGDQKLADEPAAANAPPIPSTLTVYPTIDPPLFDASTKGEYAFEMHLQFPDIFTAFQITHYAFRLYPVPKDKVTGNPQTPDVSSPATGESQGTFGLLRARLARDTDYNYTDLKRSLDSYVNMFGEPGVGLDAVALNSLMRYVGTSVSTLIEYIVDPASLKRLRFPKEGLYIVGAFATAAYSHRAEVVRSPSAAYIPVFAREPEVIAETRVGQALEGEKAAQDRILELVLKLNEKDVPNRAELQKELDGLKAQTGSVGKILLYQKQTLTDRKTDTKNPPSAKEIEQIDARIKAIDLILEVRGKRGLDDTAERLNAVMVADSGQTINLLLELVDQTKPGDDLQTWMVYDSTTPNGHQAKGIDKDPLQAKRKGVKALLEKGGYGRGYTSVVIDKQVLMVRIEADAAGQMNEALANASLLLSIAAVAAAPFTGGSSLVLLIPAGVVGAIPSAYRLAERGSEHTLRFDMEAAMDVVNIVGAVVGLGAEAQLGKRSIWLGRALLVTGIGAGGTGVVLMGAQLMEQIEALDDLPAGMRAARLTEILGNAMLQAGIMLGSALMAKSRISETARSVEENESLLARWKDENLDKPTRDELEKNPQAKAIYAEMPEVVRELLTLCGSFCIPMNPPPTNAQVSLILKLAEKLPNPADQRWLKGYLHENRGPGFTKALQSLEKVPIEKLPQVLRGLVTEPSIVVLMAFSEEFRTPELKKAAEALMNKGTIPVEKIGGIMDKVRRQQGGNPGRMLRYLDQLGDKKPANYEKVLRDLEIGGGLHKGAEWVLRFLIDSAGDLLSKVSAFEEEAEPGGRRWDFVIDGERFQLKSWSVFWESSFLRQMIQDYRLTGNFEAGLVRWVFDSGLGNAADIVKMMGDSLERAVGVVDGYDRATVDNIRAQLPRIVSVGLK